MAATGIAEAKVLVDVLKLAQKEGWLDKALDAFKKKHRVLVLGASGVGKTQLLSSLTAATTRAIDYMQRTEFAKEYAIKIDKEPFRFTDTPGEIPKRARRRVPIRVALSKGVSGIINVVCGGYHETRADDLTGIFQDGRVNERYLQRNRDIEVDALAEWVDLLGHADTTGWLITVANKIDLWCDRRVDILAFYESGKYYESLGAARALSPITVPYCAVPHKFYGVAPLAGCVDEGDRLKMRSNLLRVLLQAVGKGRLDG